MKTTFYVRLDESVELLSMNVIDNVHHYTERPSFYSASKFSENSQ